MQRIVDRFHVDAREASPDAADGIERTILHAAQIEFRQTIVHQLARLVGIALGAVHQAQRPERQRERIARLAAPDADHVEAAASEIGDEPVRVRNAGDHAFGGDARFVLARQNAHRRAPGGFGAAHELRAVRRIARRRRRHRFAHGHAQSVSQHPESRQRLQRHGAALAVQAAARHHVAADAADRFLVVQRRRRARFGFVDDETHGIRADIDDRNGTARLGTRTRPRRSANIRRGG